ncbi:hypothetical protein DMB44_04230 [Thermoplasma sp. Kam2015]|uniref:hypothetical protein n=1 Tax=Thermoplasma sp. Kam2015 TaxID=2094122 RepID=UPI000D87DAF7|nr:hypothetical protein [Thermoplasma sp. Kam2015]PYB68548.1 hypothetical protein DMB44_04230 [Thermoplasma sp. Kam2015]
MKKINIEPKVDYGTDEGAVSLNYGPFSTDINFVWHRGTIALPYGKISVSTYELGEFVDLNKSKSTYLAWETLDRILEDHTDKKFGSSYIEFLYPGSPGYGFNITLPYIDYDYTEKDFKDDYAGYYSYGVIKRGYRKYVKLVEVYNEIMSGMEREIIAITENVQRMAEEEESNADTESVE